MAAASKGGKGFGESVKVRSGDKRSKDKQGLRSEPPNLFSSRGRAERHRRILGQGMPAEWGVLGSSDRMLKHHEALQERYSGYKPATGATRQRGSKKAAAFHALSTYSVHFLQLLEEELLHEEREVMQRLRHWTRGRLQEEGLAVFGVVARSRGRLFKEHILRFTLPTRRGGNKWSGNKWDGGAKNGNTFIPKAPPLPYYRLGPGDIISITPDRCNPLNAGSQVLEGIVLERGSWYVDVVVKELPAGVNFKRNDPTGGERFRLDLYLNRISFQRMVAAVHQVTDMETGYTVAPEIREILVKSFIERFDMVFPSQHMQPSHNGPYHTHTHANNAASTSAAAAVARDRESALSAAAARKGGAVSPYKLTAAQTAAASSKGGRGQKEAMKSAAERRSQWERLAGAVAKTPLANRKDAESAVTQEVKQHKLNPSQEKALRHALSRKLSLIQGPPGTGKTRTACHLINIAVRLNGKRDVGKVLAVAFSNVAADNLLEGCLRLGLKAVRVGRAATVRPELRDYTLDAMLADHESVRTFKKKLEEVKGGSKSSRDVQAARRDLEDAELLAAISILGNADVVVSTCVGAANDAIVDAVNLTGGIDGGGATGGPAKGRGRHSVLKTVRFPIVIVDEASQATEPATLVPLTQGCEQLILVGDHHQLPPTIKSRRAASQGLGVSLFTRLALCGISPSMLTVQYRMHPLIAHFPSRRFYGGLLKSHPSNRRQERPEGFNWPNPTLPVAFVAVSGSDNGPFFEQKTSGNQTSYMNRREAEVVVDTLNSFLGTGKLSCKDIGVVTPYSAQVKHLTELSHTRLRTPPGRADKPWMDLEIQSVDAYQGREKELIIFSAVRSNRNGKVGFLADWRRLNVAITRAKRGLIVIGDPRTLINDRHWSAYIKWCIHHECFTSVATLKDGRAKGGKAKKDYTAPLAIPAIKMQKDLGAQMGGVHDDGAGGEGRGEGMGEEEVTAVVEILEP